MNEERSIAQAISRLTRKQRQNLTLLGIAVVLQLNLVVLAGVSLAQKSIPDGAQGVDVVSGAVATVEQEEEKSEKTSPTISSMEDVDKKAQAQFQEETILNPIDDAFNALPARPISNGSP